MAAVLHALWNLLAKQAADSGPSFIWLVSATSSVLLAPVALVVLTVGPVRFGTAGVAFAAGSAVLHVGYFFVLQVGYRVGDLTTVYPVARGTGPLLATIGAIVVLGERPSVVGVLGAILVAGGVFALAFDGTGTGSMSGVGAGLLTGLFIAGYTVWDAEAVAGLAITPVFYSWATALGETCLLGPLAVRRRATVAATWRAHRLDVVGVAVLSTLAYLLVLVALTMAPVSYVAPAREMSIVLGALLGGRLLGEARSWRRLGGASVVAAGVVALAVG